MNTNSALIVPAQTGTNAVDIVFQEAPKAPIEIASWAWIWWVAALFFLLGIVCLFVILFLRKRNAFSALPPVIPAHDRARRALERALNLISDPQAFSVAVSDAIRQYLEERFSFHAPDRTTEEFLHELQGTDLLTSEQKESLAQFLSQCDLVKFAKYEPTETELLGLHGSALKLVNETEPRAVAADIGANATVASASGAEAEKEPATK